MNRDERCYSCDANWRQGAFSPDCKECGGGAMEIGCIFCQGECDSVWVRAVDDSHFRRVGHWVQTGPCGAGKGPTPRA